MGHIALVLAGGTPFSHGVSVNTLVEEAIPEHMKELCEITEWSRQPSSHYSIRLTTDLLEFLRSQVAQGCSGIVVVCGSDVMEEMAYLVDLLWSYEQPVIFTEVNHLQLAQGESGMQSLKQAIAAAASPKLRGLGVMVCFRCELFAASEVTKLSNHRGNDFMSPGNGAIGEVVLKEVYINRIPNRPVALPDTVMPARDVEIIWASLGGGEALMSAMTKHDSLRGLVMAGFGAGNVMPSWIPHIKTLLKKRITLVISSRCNLGRVITISDFEASASKLMELGVYSSGNLRPIQARLRLAVALGAGLEGDTLLKYLMGDMA